MVTTPRLWLVFFNDGHSPAWWARLLRPGFQHVCAASYFSDQERWVYVNPSRNGLVVEVCTGEEFGPRFQKLVTESAAVLRVRSQRSLRRAPAFFYCVGAVKALVGIRSGALSPFGLYRHLLRAGAEQVERPDDVIHIRRRADAPA